MSRRPFLPSLLFSLSLFVTLLGGQVQRRQRGIFVHFAGAGRAGGGQQGHDVVVSAERRHVHGRNAAAVLCVGLGAVLQHNLHQLNIGASLAGEHQRRVAVDVGSGKRKAR